MNASASPKRAKDAVLAEGVIENLALFEGVGRQTIRQTAAHARLLRLSRGEVIVRAGEPVYGLLAVAYGSVKKTLRQARGNEVVLRLLGPGDTFAEAPMLLGEPSHVDAVALADSMVVLVAAPWIVTLLQRDHRFARNMANALAGRTQEMLEELQASMQRSARRLAAYLHSIAQRAPLPGVWLARLPVSKTLLAARLGMKKETLSRLLREFIESGLISVSHRDITILDRARLAEAGGTLLASASQAPRREAMALDPKRTGRLDDSRINIEQEYEVRYWCEKLRTSAEQLKSAVAKVGPVVKHVREHLELQH